MKSKKDILLKIYPSIKKQFGDLISISDLASSSHINKRTIQRYLADGTIYSFEITPKKRAIIVDSILPDFKIPSENIYCNEKDLNFSDLKLAKKFKVKKITFKNTHLFCMISLHKVLGEIKKKERFFL